MTNRERAEAMVADGSLCKTFDYALPQAWVDDVHIKTGVWPQTLGVVWAYPEVGPGRIWGLPVALTPEAQALLDRYEKCDKARGSRSFG